MTIALDNSVGISVDYAKTATASITVGSGTNRIAIVEIEGAQSEITSITVGAQTATFYAAYDNSSGSPVSAWYVLNPTSGPQTVTVTYVSGTAESSGVVTSWSGVDQTTPFVSNAGRSGPYLATPSDVPLASALSGGQVALSFIASKPFSGDTFVAGGTLIASKSNGGSAAGAVLAAAQYYTAGGTPQTEWTWATSSAQKQASHLAIVLNPASGGAASGTATGAALTGTASIAAGSASGGSAGSTNGTAGGAALTGTATIAGGTASGTVSTGTLITNVLKNNTGTVLANETGVTLNIYNASTGALVLQATGLTTNASGIITVNNAAIVSGASYAYEPVLTGGRRKLTVKAAA